MSEEISKESAAEVDFTAARQQYVDNRDKEVMERRNKATGYFGHQLDALVKRIATESDSGIDAHRAVAQLFEVLGNGFEAHGDSIANRIVTFIKDDLDRKSSQVQELEARLNNAEERAEQAEQAKTELERGQEDLQRSADRASDLQIKLRAAEANETRLKTDLEKSQERVQELQTTINKPNPLTQQVNELQDTNAHLKTENDELKKQIVLVEDGESSWGDLLKRVAPERFDDMGRWVERPRDSKKEDSTPAPDPTPTPEAAPAPQTKPSTKHWGLPGLPGRRKKEN